MQWEMLTEDKTAESEELHHTAVGSICGDCQNRGVPINVSSPVFKAYVLYKTSLRAILLMFNIYSALKHFHTLTGGGVGSR